MIVTLDGRRLEWKFPPECTLQAVIDQVRLTQPPDRLIVSVAIDGRDCGTDELEARLKQPVRDDEQVDLASDDRRSVAATALRFMAGQIGSSAELQAQTAARLNAGEAADAIRQIGSFVQLWQMCRQTVVECCGLLGRDLTQCVYAGQPVETFLRDLLEKLREVRDALASRDLVLLADVFHYELPELCTRWSALLEGLAADVEAA